MSPKRRETLPAAKVATKFERVELAQILEPDIPARASMSSEKMLELEESMRTIGQIEPITVEVKGKMFAIITGHRRFLAARALGWSTIAAIVYPAGAARTFALRLHENVVREDLNPAEEALFMAQAKEKFNLDEIGLCELFHRSADYIGRRFSLLRGDPEIFGALQRDEIRVGVAHELNRIKDDNMRRYYLDCARRSDPPQRVVQQWVSDLAGQAGFTVQLPAGAAAALAAGQAAGAANLGGANGGSGSGSGAAVGPENQFCCGLCGGSRDPYNLVTVFIHRWEWEQIKQTMERVGRVG